MEASQPNADINRLREIGWAQWDPIGISIIMGGWKGQPFEDEYDRYLIKAEKMLQNNCAFSEVVDYLFFIESQYMGLGPIEINDQIRARLLKVVQAISDDILI